MNILFIYPNINSCHDTVYHFGLASIVGMTKQEGHVVKVSIINNLDEASALLNEIGDFNPRVIGFTSVSSQFGFVKKISTLIRDIFPEVIIVCGGVHPTIYPEALLGVKAINGFFIGESELSFIDFLRAIENKQTYFTVDNFAYLKDGAVVKNPLKPLIEDLDILPFPDKESYPYAENLKKIGYASFFFSRGCPYLCTYCSNHAIAKVYGRKSNLTRFRSPEAAVLEIEDVIKKHQVDIVSIGDDIFGLDEKWRKEFCSKYSERIKKKFMCLLRVELASEELIKMLHDAGCYRVFFGVESGNESLRREILNRFMPNERIIKAFDLCHKYRMQTLAVNMIGVPGETEGMMWDTIKLNRRLRPTTSAVNIFYPYRGTALGEKCFNDGLVDENKYEDFTNERRESVIKFDKKHKKYIMYFYNNWERLVYPYDIERHFRRFLSKIGVLNYAKKIKKSLLLILPLRRNCCE